MNNIRFADVFSEKATMEKKDQKDPCWSGYKKEGTKKKDGKTVPNCVKKDGKKSS